MTEGPRSHSSPLWPGGKASPVSGSTILASIFSAKRPVEPYRRLSSGPNVLVAPPPVSVKPYPYHKEQESQHSTIGNRRLQNSKTHHWEPTIWSNKENIASMQAMVNSYSMRLQNYSSSHVSISCHIATESKSLFGHWQIHHIGINFLWYIRIWTHGVLFHDN